MTQSRTGKAVAIALLGSTVISGGSYVTGSNVGTTDQAAQNWQGTDQIVIPTDIDAIAKRLLTNRKAHKLIIYAYDYRVPFLQGVVAYEASPNKDVTTPVKSIPPRLFVSVIADPWNNDLRQKVTVEVRKDEDDPEKIYTTISAPIEIDSLILPAGRVVIVFDRGHLSDYEVTDISDQIRGFARFLKKID